MLKDAPILLLDEATSALDSEVEAAIQQSLYRLMEGKTVVAIAHRLSTIAAMDRLIVLDRGRIVEEGDHRSLLARDGLYARLWAHQSGGFLGDEDDEARPASRSPARRATRTSRHDDAIAAARARAHRPRPPDGIGPVVVLIAGGDYRNRRPASMPSPLTTLPNRSPTTTRLAGNAAANASRSAVIPLDPPVK